MLQIFTLLLVATLVHGAPQRIQLGGGPPRPVTFGGPPTGGPVPTATYSQHINFGAPDGQRPAVSAAYRPQQPLVISQVTPTQATFNSFGSSTPFSIPGRQPVILRSPQGVTPTPATDDDEYEDEEYEDDASPVPPQPPRVTPGPTLRPIQQTAQRAPVRIANPQTNFGPQPGPGPQRFIVPQTQSQPIQRRPQAPPQRPVIQQEIQPRPVPARAPVQNSIQNIGGSGGRKRVTTPPPVQTLNRYMRTNDDGSITWGYENEDGTFKEETLGADCVVRGKYGYVDPEGNKREYEYQSGNPCDPNKRGQEEEEEDLPDGPDPNQRVAGIVNARPRPVQQQGRPVQQQPRRPYPQEQ